MARITIDELPFDDDIPADDDLKSILGAGLASPHALQNARRFFSPENEQRSENPFLKDIAPEDLLD